MSDAGTRVKLTTAKTALGGLPAPFDDPPALGIGSGGPCQGCGETIAPGEKLYAVDLFGTLTSEFHAECYESWMTFKPRQAKTA